MSDYKESDEIDQISKNDEENLTEDIEVLELENWVCKKIKTILKNNSMKEIRWIWVIKRESDEWYQISKKMKK